LRAQVGFLQVEVGALAFQAQHLDIAGRAHFDQRLADPDLAIFEKFIDKTLRARLENVVEKPFQRISYTDAVKLL
jgi:hypothetical protein